MESKKKKILNFFWPWGKRPKIKTAKKKNSKYIAWVAMSIASGFIDFIFFCNMSKSLFEIGTLFAIPAAIVYGYISLCLTYSKALHSIEINSLNQIRRYLPSNSDIAKTFFRVVAKWVVIYILYIGISVMTSASLSTISIGEGIHRNQSVIKSINTDISKLQKYYDTNDKSDDIQFQNLVAGVSNSNNAISVATKTFNDIKPIIAEYREERAEFPVAFDSTEEIEWNGNKIVPNDYWTIRNDKVLKDVRKYGVDLTLNQIRNLSDTAIQQIIKNNQEKLTSNTSAKDLTALTENINNKSSQAIKNLEGKYKDPNGNVISFDENNLGGAIDKLESLRVSYENDSGDVGSSAKIFMQIGSSLTEKKEDKDLTEIAKENTTLSSFGPTEKLMIAVLFFFGLLLELGINQFAPTGELTREGLGEFRKYFPKDFNISEFMFEITKKKLEFGDITVEQFLKEKKECEEMLKYSNMKLGDNVEDTDKLKKDLANALKNNDKINKELLETRNKLFKINLEKNKEEKIIEKPVEVIKEEPKTETIKKVENVDGKPTEVEKPKIDETKKLIVLPAEREIQDMLNK